MKYEIRIGEHPITLEHGLIDEIINVDDLTRIDTSNLFGEAVTVSAAANRVGLMKAEVEGTLADLRLDLKVFENNYRHKLRAEASNNTGNYTILVDEKEAKVKLTEKALETCYESDIEWIELKRSINKAEKNFNSLSALYWSIQDKCRKLNGLVSSTTPEEFVAGIVEGKINGILVNKSTKKAGSIK